MRVCAGVTLPRILLGVAAHLISTLHSHGWYERINDAIDVYSDTIVVHLGDYDEPPEADAVTSAGSRYRDSSRTIRTSREIGVSGIFLECGLWSRRILCF